MHKATIRRTLSVLLLTATASCQLAPTDTEHREGSGVAVTEVRPISPFAAVHNASVFPVSLRPGFTNEARVMCDDNLVDLIVTEVTGGELRIAAREGVAFSSELGCRVEITARDLEERSRIRSSGVGGIDAREVVSSDVTVTSSGVGDVHVTAVERAEVELTGLGDVHLHGAPDTLLAEDRGVGNVHVW